MKRAALLTCGLCAALVAAVSAVTGFDEPAPLRQTLLYAAYAAGAVVLGWLATIFFTRR